jgi:hypothetical protein
VKIIDEGASSFSEVFTTIFTFIHLLALLVPIFFDMDAFAIGTLRRDAFSFQMLIINNVVALEFHLIVEII